MNVRMRKSGKRKSLKIENVVLEKFDYESLKLRSLNRRRFSSGVDPTNLFFFDNVIFFRFSLLSLAIS